MNTHQPSRPVVVGVDGSEAALNAVRFAVHEAVLRGASLRLVHAISPHPQPETVYGAPDVDADYGRQVLHDAMQAAAAIENSLMVESVVLRGQPESALSIEARAACMLVVGTNAENGIAERVLGSVARSSVETSACPVAVVRRSGAESSGAVVVALGDAEVSGPDLVVAEAFREASSRGADLVALHTRSVSTVLTYALGGAADGQSDESVAERRLEQCSKRYPAVHVGTVHADASAESELVALSRTAQLMVVGHERGRQCGTTLTALLRHAKSAVLVVPHA